MRNPRVKEALRARGVFHSYPGRKEKLLALESVDITVGEGEFVAIVGPSGCGKSTLLRILGGLVLPTRGQVELRGEQLLSPKREVAFFFQKANLRPWRTVLRNVSLPLEVTGVPRAVADARSREMLALVGLEGFEDAYPRELSGGMAQRVAIARALVGNPALLLLDEPFGSLDALSRERMNLDLLSIWQVQQVTAVMVTHDLEEAVFMADRVLVMSPRPGHIDAEVVIDLPRPRTLEVMYTEFFGGLSRRVRGAIESSAAKLPAVEPGRIQTSIGRRS